MIQKVYLPDSSGNLLFLPEERPKNEDTFTELDRSDVFSEKLFLTTMEHVSL